MSRNTGLEHILSRLNCYKNLSSVRKDVHEVLSTIRTLSPKASILVLNNGDECHLLTLNGTVAITFRGATYHIPIEIYVTKDYPDAPPKPYVRPTQDMAIQKRHKHVDSAGTVYLPYLHDWAPNSHNLLGLCVAMSGVFGQDPPVYSHPPEPPAPQPLGKTYSKPYTGSPWKGAVVKEPLISSNSTYAYSKAKNDFSKDVVKGEVTAKIKNLLKAYYSDLGEQLDSEFETQSILKTNQQKLVRDLELAKMQKTNLLNLVPKVQTQLEELKCYSEQCKANIEVDKDPEDMVQPQDPLSNQLLGLVAENASIEDSLYYLDQGLTDGCIGTDEFLKEVRRLTRKQFAVRALENKVIEAQQKAAPRQPSSSAQHDQQNWRPSYSANGTSENLQSKLGNAPYIRQPQRS